MCIKKTKEFCVVSILSSSCIHHFTSRKYIASVAAMSGNFFCKFSFLSSLLFFHFFLSLAPIYIPYTQTQNILRLLYSYILPTVRMNVKENLLIIHVDMNAEKMGNSVPHIYHVCLYVYLCLFNITAHCCIIGSFDKQL